MNASTSLRRYLSFRLGLVIALQFVIVALLVWQVLLPRMRSDTGFRHQALARAIAGQVSAHMMGGERQLTALADYIESKGKQPPGYWIEVLDSQCGQGDLFEAIYLVNYQNQTIDNVGLAHLRRNKREDLMGLDLSGRDFLNRARKANRAVWSETFLSTASSRWAIAVTVPLPRQALIGEITVDQLYRFLSDLPLAPGLRTMILDRRGRVVADSQLVSAARKLYIDKLPAPGISDKGSIYSSSFELDGRQLIGSIVSVDQLGWKVLVAQSYPAAFQTIQSTFLIIALGLFTALLVGILFMWLQAHRLTRLFRFYEHNAQDIAHGQYDLQWPPAKIKEFADLQESLKQMAREINERERQLSASENRLSITLDSIGDAVITTDVHSVITRMNPAAEQLTRWTTAEATGRQLSEVFQIINGQTRQKVANPVQKVLDKGAIVGLANHTVLIDKKGRECQIADSAAPIRQADGSMVGVVLVFRDVTETYAQEKAIRESEERLDQALSVSKIGVFDQDHHTDKIYWSSQLREIFGLGPDEPVTTEDIITFFHPEDVERMESKIRLCQGVDSNGLWQDEYRIIRKDGSTRWLRGRSQTFFEGEGLAARPVRTVGATQDITERKQWEQALQASEMRYKELFHNAPVMYLITHHRDEMPYITEGNNLFLETLGYTHEEVVDTPLANYYTEDSRKELLDRHVLYLTRRGEFTSEERDLLTKDGRTIHTLMDAQSAYDVTGKSIGIRSMYLNISDRKQAEKEARRLELALLQAQKMEAIGTLAGGIAHDFNNILSAVIGYSELALAQTDNQSRLYKNVEHILAAGMRAKDLVAQILAFGRQDERELKPLQMGPLVKEALKLLRSTLPTTIEMKQTISSDLDNVMADPTHIHQIVMNLCTNAAQAMRKAAVIWKLACLR